MNETPPSFVHVTARAYRTPMPVSDHAVAAWLWQRLRAAFPDALAACIMPNHVHVLVASDDPDGVRIRLASVISGMRRSRNPGSSCLWEPASAVGGIVGPQKLERHARYIALNPCRASLTRDPLTWVWSTHRDVMGAAFDPWVQACRLARALGRQAADFRSRHHAYVSADPSAAVNGTAPPISAPPDGLAHFPIHAVLAAAVAATRGTPSDIQRPGSTRRLFIGLAARHGWRRIPILTRLCAVHRRSIYDHLASPVDVKAAQRCLGDVRLRAPFEASITAFFSQTVRPRGG